MRLDELGKRIVVKGGVKVESPFRCIWYDLKAPIPWSSYRIA